jgi:hypothetical protein
VFHEISSTIPNNNHQLCIIYANKYNVELTNMAVHDLVLVHNMARIIIILGDFSSVIGHISVVIRSQTLY